MKGNICNPKAAFHIECPMTATDEITMTSDFSVPFFVPNGDFEITMSAKDLDGNEIICVNIQYSLGDKSSAHLRENSIDLN